MTNSYIKGIYKPPEGLHVDGPDWYLFQFLFYITVATFFLEMANILGIITKIYRRFLEIFQILTFMFTMAAIIQIWTIKLGSTRNRVILASLPNYFYKRQRKGAILHKKFYNDILYFTRKIPAKIMLKVMVTILRQALDRCSQRRCLDGGDITDRVWWV